MTKIFITTSITENAITKTAHFEKNVLPNVYFKFPKAEELNLTDRADPFVHCLIFPMMELGGTFEIEGKVSRSVIKNMTMFCRIWQIWCPQKYKSVHLIASEEIDDDYRPNNNRLITAFSGGLDAAYTTYKYKKQLDDVFLYNLDKSVMLLGADIPLSSREQFNIAFANAKKMTDDLGVTLVPVETNFREVYHTDWSYAFGSVILATLEFFSKTYFCGAASDDSIHHFQTPWGMNPITDQYLTSDTFRFISDGHEHSRTDRASLIKDWKIGVENLRVCWRNDDKSKNCGRCEKCVRTKLNFMAVGVNHLPSMPNDLTEEELLNDCMIQIPHNILYYQEIYDYARKHHTLSNKWMKLLSSQLNVWNKKFSSASKRKKHHHSFWWHLRHLKF
jgi:hypothetical protein